MVAVRERRRGGALVDVARDHRVTGAGEQHSAFGVDVMSMVDRCAERITREEEEERM